MKQEVTLKSIPYGEASFEMLRNLGYAYVDKTSFIARLEKYNARLAFIARPRRFGKSLFANMLTAYYDKAAAPEFKKNFEGTWIGEHPTPLANRFLVLKFDFSGIDGGEGFVQHFIENVKSGLRKFATRYLKGDSKMEALLDAAHDSPAALLCEALGLIENRFREKIYLVIDESDLFANDLLENDPARLREIMRRQSLLQHFYDIVKDQSQTVIARAFITGVTSFTTDSPATGFGIAIDVSKSREFAGMLGFTEEELRALIPQVVDTEHCGLSADAIFKRMKALYEGHRFSPHSDTEVFNPSMCLHYLNALANMGKEPAILLDPAFASGTSKLKALLSLGGPNFAEKVIRDVLFEKPISFGGWSSVVYLWAADELSEQNALAALAFMGYLTFAPGGGYHLVCPNEVLKAQFFQIWFRRICRIKAPFLPAESLKNAEEHLASGDLRPLLDLVSAMLRKGDDTETGAGELIPAHLVETAIPLAALMALNTSDLYRGSAEEAATDSGSTRLVLRPRESRPDAAGWVIEFKFVKAGKADAKSEAVVAEKLDEAVAQLERDSGTENIAAIPNLRRAAAVFAGTELRALKTF